jgi:hypothetical protein
VSFPPCLKNEPTSPNNKILNSFKGGICKMNFRRKLAALLAFVMAFSAIASLSVLASPIVGTQAGGINVFAARPEPRGAAFETHSNRTFYVDSAWAMVPTWDTRFDSGVLLGQAWRHNATNLIIPSSMMGPEGADRYIEFTLSGFGGDALIEGFSGTSHTGRLGVVPATASATDLLTDFGFYRQDSEAAPKVVIDPGVGFAQNITYRYTGLAANAGGLGGRREIPYQFTFRGGNTVRIEFVSPGDDHSVLRFPIPAKVNLEPPGRGVITIDASNLSGNLATEQRHYVVPGAGTGTINVSVPSGAPTPNLRTASAVSLTIAESARNMLQSSTTISNANLDANTVAGINGGVDTNIARGFRVTLPPEYVWAFTSAYTNPVTDTGDMRLQGVNLPQFTVNSINPVTITPAANGTFSTLPTALQPNAAGGDPKIARGVDVNGQDFIDIIFPAGNLLRPNLGVASIILSRMEVQFRNPWAPNPPYGDINATVSQLAWQVRDINVGATAEWRWVANTNPDAEVGGFGGNPVDGGVRRIAILADQAIRFIPMTHESDALENHVIVAGRLPNPVTGALFNPINPLGTGVSNGGGATGVSGPRVGEHAGEFSTANAREDARHINTRGVRIEQNVFGFGQQSVLAAPVTYSLVDAEGNPLEGVAMRAVQFSANNAPTASQNPTGHAVPAGQRGVSWTVNFVPAGNLPEIAERVGSSVSFHPNGQEVTVLTGTRGGNPAQHLNARFAIVADANFRGEVYVKVTSPFLDTQLGDNNILQIATVRPGVVVAVETTVVPVGFSNTVLADIVISETEPGDLTTGEMRIAIDQPFGWGQVVFGSLTAAQARNVVSVGGSTLPGQRPTVVLHGTDGTENHLNLTLTRIATNLGTEPAVITLSGLRVVSPWGTINQGLFGLSVDGLSVTNISTRAYGAANFNWTGTELKVGNEVGGAGFFRWAQGPLVVANVIDVGGTGIVSAVVPVTAGVNWAGGGSFFIDGEARSFTNAQGVALTAMNIDGRLFVPMRAVIEGMGGTIEFFAGVNGAPHRLITNLPGAVRPEVIWTVGLAEVNAVGVVRPLTNAPMIWNGPGQDANIGSTFLPLRGIAEAHGLILSEGDAANPQATITLQP